MWDRSLSRFLSATPAVYTCLFSGCPVSLIVYDLFTINPPYPLFSRHSYFPFFSVFSWLFVQVAVHFSHYFAYFPLKFSYYKYG